jgi:hypothetical protein
VDYTPTQREYIASIASEAITRMTEVADKATKALSESRTISHDVLAFPNATNAAAALKNLTDSSRAIWESNRHLTTEPVLARVLVFDANNQARTYYICRTTPVSGVQNLASYRSPVGRLASLAIGDSSVLPNGDELEVAERAILHPECDKNGWDSKRTEVDTDKFGPVTVPSLRDFHQLFDNSQQVDDILIQIEAEEKLSEALMAGLQRSVITKMGLRDQPILNSIQDAIFRLPIDRQLILLGPPGTGKTTTLIRRLGQKLDRAYLTEDENDLIDAAQTSHKLPHEESWLMFTPTKLLRLYLKEAFAREQVPAPDARIQTWDDYRWWLSKNVFGVLRSSTGSGHYVLRPDSKYLRVEAQTNGIGWYEDYFVWQRAEYQRELSEAAESLASSTMEGARALSSKLQQALSTGGWNALVAEVPKAQGLVGGIKGSSGEKINGALKAELKKNTTFIDELAQFLDTLGQESEARSEDSEEGDASDEDEDVEVALTPKTKAIKRYKDALRARARSLAAKRTQDKTSVNAKVLAWIGDRRLSDSELTEIGQQLLTQSYARRFVSPVNRYINGFHRRYSKFRKLRQSEGAWYESQPIESRDIHPLELDVIVLAILRASKEFLSRSQIVRQLDEPVWSGLKSVFDLYRHQILVDEATDFSPLQLACMASITHPTTRSFFACGDFNQRLTTWGTRSEGEVKWIMPGLEFQEVNIAYRQTRQLNTLARDIVTAVGGNNPIVELPKNVDNEGVAPALLEEASDLATLTHWLADRLGEIEQFLQGQPMPSTAIFVNSEEDVAPLAEQLDRLLIENNLRVVACSQGQIVGQDTDIRVFDIQHIKGLEFEAVFFVGVDSLAEKHPTLFDKYLYVGATRAATYLGLTCNQRLPRVIESLRPQFTSDWSMPARANGGDQ